METQEKIRYCLYARKSTESDEKQALSINSQIDEMMKIAKRNGLNVVSIKQESHSAKQSGQRPVFNQIIEDIKKGEFNGILTWAPDRLSRNAGDLGTIVDLMDSKVLLEVRTFGQTFTNSPNEKFLLMILGSQAKLENDNKSINVKRGLRAKVSLGLWIGPAPVGYLNDNRKDRKGHVLIDSQRAPIVKKMFELAAQEWSGRRIYQWLKNDLDFKAKSGKHLALSNIYLILKNPFYTGRFEYPRNSNNWYTGKHKPLISQELFQKVQNQLERDNIQRTAIKEFAFTRLMKCGSCGSGITADEKFKKLKDGTINRYVYYCCTKSKDLNCKEKALREKDLIEQLLGIVDHISLDQLGMKQRINNEIQRYNDFRCGVLGIEKKELEEDKKINAKKYALHILKQGSIYEKRELLRNLKSKLVLKEKEIYLEQ